MTLTIQDLSPEAFQQTEKNYPSSNFLQSLAMAKVQEQRPVFDALDFIGFFDNGQLVGQAVIYYRRRYRYFKEAILLHGPLLDYRDQAMVEQAFKALVAYCRQQGVAHLELHPYLTNNTLSDDLSPLATNQAIAVKETLERLGFQHSFDELQQKIVSRMFVKPFDTVQGTDDLFAQLPNSLKRDIKKFTEAQVHIRELDVEELEVFYDILQITSEHKHFHLQELSYFKHLKTAFKDDAKFLLAYLDCPAYEAYLKKNILSFEQVISQLTEKPLSKRTRGALADAKDQLASYEKRLSQFQELGTLPEHLPLSAYLFICHGHEISSLLGGTYREYLNFGGATLLNWHMIQYAYAKGFERYNFYGTLETEQASGGTGNFNFKRQFQGQLEELVGTFSITLNPLYGLLTKLKP